MRSYYIEFSRFAPLADYLALAQTLLALGFVCYDSAGSANLGGTKEIDQYLQGVFASGVLATNLWFIAG